MGMLIKNEFYKLKREWFMAFLLMLSLLPILTGGSGAVFNNSTKSLADLKYIDIGLYLLINILSTAVFHREFGCVIT